LQPTDGTVKPRGMKRKLARPAAHATVELITEFFVSTTPAGGYPPCRQGLLDVPAAGRGAGSLCKQRARPGGREGVSGLGFADDRDDNRRRGPAPPPGGSGDPPKGKRKRGAPELGQALRAAYQRTIDEQIPPEMLDLLGKLG
jgi:hypothetical protein